MWIPHLKKHLGNLPHIHRCLEEHDLCHLFLDQGNQTMRQRLEFHIPRQ